MQSIRQQIHRNAVALISLVIAVSSLGYNSWRNETSEAQRNIRHASFRVLESLGELQEVTDHRFYYLPYESTNENEGRLRLRGYGSVALIRDLTMLMPSPAPAAGEALHEVWGENVSHLAELDQQGNHSERSKHAEREITHSVHSTRAAILQVLKSLE